MAGHGAMGKSGGGADCGGASLGLGMTYRGRHHEQSAARSALPRRCMKHAMYKLQGLCDSCEEQSTRVQAAQDIACQVLGCITLQGARARAHVTVCGDGWKYELHASA